MWSFVRSKGNQKFWTHKRYRITPHTFNDWLADNELFRLSHFINKKMKKKKNHWILFVVPQPKGMSFGHFISLFETFRKSQKVNVVMITFIVSIRLLPHLNKEFLIQTIYNKKLETWDRVSNFFFINRSSINISIDSIYKTVHKWWCNRERNALLGIPL